MYENTGIVYDVLQARTLVPEFCQYQFGSCVLVDHFFDPVLSSMAVSEGTLALELEKQIFAAGKQLSDSLTDLQVSIFCG